MGNFALDKGMRIEKERFFNYNLRNIHYNAAILKQCILKRVENKADATMNCHIAFHA